MGHPPFRRYLGNETYGANKYQWKLAICIVSDGMTLICILMFSKFECLYSLFIGQHSRFLEYQINGEDGEAGTCFEKYLVGIATHGGLENRALEY